MKKTNANILVVDDQEEVLIAAKLTLKRYFDQVITLSDPSKILSTIATHEIDIVLLDMNFRLGYEDGKEGIYRLKEVQENFPAVKLILMTSYAQVDKAVEGIKLGAIDYMMKPWDNERLVETIKQTIKQIRKNKTKEPEKKQEQFIGKSEAIVTVYKMAERVAKTDANVLILGENGTGKFVLASYIHHQSSRRNQPFVHVDLGSLNENIFESELFGYAKGAFTDAKQDTAGRFESAEGGTIFLDEIGNIPAHLQSKLLQVIQSKSVIRLGESRSRALDVRIITATNTDLKKAVEEKVFREDLFYRINTISLELPPLRARQEDLEEMIHYFIQIYAHKYGMDIPEVDPTVISRLKKYNWPGNIRELQNRIERSLILSENNQISLNALGFNEEVFVEFQKKDTTLLEIEKQTIETTLRKFQYNVSKSAEELGLSRQSLYRKIEKYNIQI